MLSNALFNQIGNVLQGVLGNYLFSKVLLKETEQVAFQKEFDKAFAEAVEQIGDSQRNSLKVLASVLEHDRKLSVKIGNSRN